MKDRYKRFWANDKLENIARVESLQQGDWDIREYLRSLKKKLGCNTIVDFGCGYGRLFPVFSDVPTTYFGIDLNPGAINEARKRYPQFRNRFVEVDINSAYAKADMFLVFTVFLHLDDETLSTTLGRIYNSCNKYIVVIETLGREWRPEYDPKENPLYLPLYNRDLDEYITLMESQGFYLKEQDKKYNPYYGNQERYEGYNCHTNILIFGKI